MGTTRGNRHFLPLDIPKHTHSFLKFSRMGRLLPESLLQADSQFPRIFSDGANLARVAFTKQTHCFLEFSRMGRILPESLSQADSQFPRIFSDGVNLARVAFTKQTHSF